MNNQYEFITTLQFRIKNLQAQVDAFKNGSKYQQMDAQYKSMLHTEECHIYKLEAELSKAHAQTIEAVDLYLLLLLQMGLPSIISRKTKVMQE